MTPFQRARSALERTDWQIDVEMLANVITEAVAEEREECAKAAKKHIQPIEKGMSSPCYYSQGHECADEIADDIRRRGKP